MPKHSQGLPEHSHAIPSKTERERLAGPDRPRPVAPGAILQRAALAPRSLRPADIVRLQQTLGNRAVGQLLSQSSPVRSLVQTKLTVNAPGDKYEQEADRVAEDVMATSAVQRAALENEDAKPAVMTMPQPSPAAGGAFEAGEAFEQKLRAARGHGQPLPPVLREDFETRFGANFGGVRIHADAQSDLLNRSIRAQAFTTGQDVFFRQGEDNLSSLSGQWTLAHELTHVVQQGGGRPDRAQTPTASTTSDFPVQRLVSKADFEKLAGKPSAKSKLDKKGGTYTDILKKLEAYEKEKKNKTLVELKALCTKWINAHTRVEITSGEREAKKTKDLRKADYIQGLLEEVKAELGEPYDQDVSTPTALTQRLAWKFQTATAAATADLKAPPASRYVLTLLASVENPDLLPFAKKRLELTIENKTNIFGKQKTGKEIKSEAAASVVEAKRQVLTDEAKKAAIDKIADASSEVGHTWVKLKKFDAKDKELVEHSFGFYPLQGYNRPELAVPGKVDYGDTLHDRDRDQLAKNFELTADEYSQALGKALEIMEKRPDYKLVDYNCTAFAKEVVKAAGQEFPGKAFMRVPGNAVSAVSGVGWGKAYNPNALYGGLKSRASVYIPEASQKAQRTRAFAQLQSEDALILSTFATAEEAYLWYGISATSLSDSQPANIPATTEIKLTDVSDNEVKFDAGGTIYKTSDLKGLCDAVLGPQSSNRELFLPSSAQRAVPSSSRGSHQFIPSGQPQPQGALQLGEFGLSGAEEESQSETMEDRLRSQEGKKLSLSNDVTAMSERNRKEVALPRGTLIHFYEVTDDGFARFDVAGGGFHRTNNLRQLVNALNV
jgi:hypothetical protein